MVEDTPRAPDVADALPHAISHAMAPDIAHDNPQAIGQADESTLATKFLASILDQIRTAFSTTTVMDG